VRHALGVNGGRLLALEGLDGCGKSTQAERLVGALRAADRDVLATREPTDGPSGRRIREAARRGESLAAEEELRLFVDDRAAHVEEVIAPALRAGRVVVTDRYTLSTVAYQGARGLDWRALLAESEARFPRPDLVLLLEIEPAAGLARAASRGAPLDPLFERPAFLARVAAIFGAIDRDYVARIDASAGADAVARAVVECVRERTGLL